LQNIIECLNTHRYSALVTDCDMVARVEFGCEGAEATLGNPNLLAVIAETNGGYRCYGYELNDVLGPLGDLGFRSIEYDPHTRRATWALQRENTRGNTILARDLQLVQNRVEAAPAVMTLAGQI